MEKRTKRPLEGQVALVTGGDEEIGSAVALALSARGVCVVVMGPHERSLGNVVGEIANGGGKARHVAGDPRDPDQVRAAVAKATDTFGAIDIAVAVTQASASTTFDAAARAMKGPGCLLLVSSVASDASLAAFLGATARELAPRGITCNALCPGGLALPAPAPEPEDIAQIAVSLCAPTFAALTGQCFVTSGSLRVHGA